MRLSTKKWVWGILAGFIGGGAGAFSSGIATQMIEPGIYFWHKIEIMGATFLVAGITHAAAYLAQSPLPPAPWDGTDERRSPAEMQVRQVSPTKVQVDISPEQPTGKS